MIDPIIQKQAVVNQKLNDGLDTLTYQIKVFTEKVLDVLYGYSDDLTIEQRLAAFDPSYQIWLFSTYSAFHTVVNNLRAGTLNYILPFDGVLVDGNGVHLTYSVQVNTTPGASVAVIARTYSQTNPGDPVTESNSTILSPITADVSGIATITGIASGQITITVSKDRYISNTITINIQNNQIISIPLVLSPSLSVNGLTEGILVTLTDSNNNQISQKASNSDGIVDFGVLTSSGVYNISAAGYQDVQITVDNPTNITMQLVDTNV